MTNLNISVPLSASRAGYDPEAAKKKYAANKDFINETYHYEKWTGKRKQNGALKLNSLSTMHKQIISAHINGMKGVEIAEQFDIAAITVYRIIGDPLVQDMIEEFDDGFKADFKSMFPLVSDAIRDGLGSASQDFRLKAVDRFVKICRLIDGDEPSGDTEGRVTAVTAARMKFVQLVQKATGTALIEGEAETLVIEETVSSKSDE